MTEPLLPFDDAGRPADVAANGAWNSPRPERTRLKPPAHRNAPPGTSHVAARRIAGHAPTQRADVLAVIVRAGLFGATDAEVEAATGIRAQSVSPRRGELVALGLIADTGQRRPTPSGRLAAVWVARTLALGPTIGPEASDDAGRPEGGRRWRTP